MPGEPHPESYYAASARPWAERPALAGTRRVDVCVIGGGYSGVSAALNLAERGYSVALLEAERIGWGASGRNGGQICTAYASGMDPISGAVGAEDARRLFAMAEDSKAILRDRVGRHAIACDLKWGYFHGAHKARQLDGLKAMQESWEGDYGYAGLELCETRESVRRHVASTAYRGGLFDPGSGHLHPLNYCLGLAAAAAEAGVEIFEGARVTELVPGREVELKTAKGSVKAKAAVLCGNAYMGGLVPAIRRKIMPVGTYVAATVPLGAERARDLLPSDAAISDCNFVLNYYRLSADHRMLFGGGVSYTTIMPPGLPAVMRRKMLAVFPDLASELGDQAFEYVWGGNVAITAERTPHFGRLGDNVYFIHGFSGQGVALTGLAGVLAAEAIAGDSERFDVFARLPHTTFPGGRLFRAPTLALAMLWYRLRDLLP